MGNNIFDQYTLLHFASGIIMYFWGLSFTNMLLLHTLFEYLENTQTGMALINNTLGGIWPGGKSAPDTFANSIVGDTVGAIIGWILANYLDFYGSRYGWYQPHLA